MEERSPITDENRSFAKMLFEHLHGIDVDEIVKKAEKAEKNKKQIILNLYNKIGLNAKQIANTINEDLSFVKNILKQENQSN